MHIIKRVGCCLLLVFVGCGLVASPSQPLHALQAFATWKSEEGIIYISKSPNRDELGLKKLHSELKRNRHGKELYKLKSIVVENFNDPTSNGTYEKSNRTITLFNGKERTTPEDMRHTLSHEYGHHVQTIYFPEITTTLNNEWAKLRGIRNHDVILGCCGSGKNHPKYTNEIFADDYALLFGSKGSIKTPLHLDENHNNVHLLYNETMFHRNREIPNIYHLYRLHEWLESKLGWKIITSPMVDSTKDINFKRNRRILTVDIPWVQDRTFYDVTVIRNNKTKVFRGTMQKPGGLYQSTTSIPVHQLTQYIEDKAIALEYYTLDTELGIGVRSEKIYLKPDGAKVGFQPISEDEWNQIKDSSRDSKHD